MWRANSMHLMILFAIILLPILVCSCASSQVTAGQSQSPAYLGFDRNVYPGDDALPVLRKTFIFASYWLSPPPGEKINTWRGKRELLHSQGFGFAVLYRGRETRELKTETKAKEKGDLDARNAAASAKEEGFAAGTVIFLDIEEGGRLPADYHVYLKRYTEQLEAAGFRSGAYCSAIPVAEGHAAFITTAKDIEDHIGAGRFSFWVYNDACPPSPGCVFPKTSPNIDQSGFPTATIWQYAQSPRRKQFTAQCAATYAADGNCYAPQDAKHQWFLDANTATSRNPSEPAQPEKGQK